MAQQQMVKEERSLGDLFSELAERNQHARSSGSRAGSNRIDAKGNRRRQKRRFSGGRRRGRIRGAARRSGGGNYRFVAFYSGCGRRH